MQFLAVAAVLTTAVSALPALVERQQTYGAPTYEAETYGGLNYSARAVLHHNLHRSNHSATNVTWDDDLASSAKKVADLCIFEHKMDVDGGNYGQNLAAGVPADNITSVITDLWYGGEVSLYPAWGRNPSQSEMSNFVQWGHFTQLVWKNTTIIGCATTDCSSQGGVASTGGNVEPYLTVCHYKGPGNYAGQYGEQVGESLGNATIAWNDFLDLDIDINLSK
ncbi:Cell wall protein PRY3 [Cercospora beticola]|uniref:Cell wall protein PRY3 n=1 Tax=Cercospora beticola TaxID=122368 RepID=A0A2G5HT99_CERBT|nr:Cell wall protein PRY3 [Cercospora beticola]PIA95759.1 Cell wall protein PRY3 [Cercospora beticola]WPB07051.1 hypothetical protein RHO25_011711 [Cercospora beticola]CAK1366996.1 unnamed protein product [Cercospora beticola]